MWVALKRTGCHVVAFVAMSAVPVFRNFFNSLLTLCLSSFFSRLSTSLLCSLPLKIQTFLSKSCLRRWKPCCLLTNNAMTSAVTNFWCHKLITIVSKKKNSDMENFICNRYGERLHILNTKHIKICLRLLSYLLNIYQKLTFLFPKVVQ